MNEPIPQDLLDYFSTMISPPEKPAYYIPDTGEESIWADIAKRPDASLGAIIAVGTPTEAQAKEMMRVLLPGAHMILVAPESEPTGHTGACQVEDIGFEIRDAILLADEDRGIHYVPKAGRKEREAGCAHLDGKTGAEATDREEGSAGLKSPRAGAGRTAARVKNFHPCLHPDGLVVTIRGFRPIREIRVGDLVLAEDGCFHIVEALTEHPYTSEELVEIAVKGTNYKAPVSDNHPFKVWRPTRKRNAVVGGEVLWLDADQVRKGDYTMTPLLAEKPATDPLSCDTDFWFILGLFVAEGSLQKAGHGSNVYPSFSLHENETHLIDRIRAYCGETSVYPKPGSKGVQAMAFNPKVGALCAEIAGSGAATKSLDPRVWSLPETSRRALVEGYLAGDGGMVRTYRQAKTVSPDIASQMLFLAESIGMSGELNWTPAQPGHIGDRQFKTTQPTYVLRFYDRNVGQTTRKPSRPTLMEHQGVKYRLKYVKAVKRIPYKGVVLNLSVEGSHTFQTAVGMTHNTVKPLELMQRLMADVPKGQGAVLDPFLGSGTTAVAAVTTGHSVIGIEREREYLEIADARVRHWVSQDMALRQSGVEILSDTPKPPPPPKQLSFEDAFGFGDDE